MFCVNTRIFNKLKCKLRYDIIKSGKNIQYTYWFKMSVHEK